MVPNFEFLPAREARRLNGDNDGSRDEIDEKYRVQIAHILPDYVAEVNISLAWSDKASAQVEQWFAELSFKCNQRFEREAFDTEQEAKDWCISTFPSFKQGVDNLLAMSAKFDEGLHCITRFENPAFVWVSKRDDIAVVWSFGWETETDIDKFEYELVPVLAVVLPTGTYQLKMEK